jgi:hypothetical protein
VVVVQEKGMKDAWCIAAVVSHALQPAVSRGV